MYSPATLQGNWENARKETNHGVRPQAVTEHATLGASLLRAPNAPFGGTLRLPQGGSVALPLTRAETLIDYSKPLNSDKTQSPSSEWCRRPCLNEVNEHPFPPTLINPPRRSCFNF